MREERRHIPGTARDDARTEPAAEVVLDALRVPVAIAGASLPLGVWISTRKSGRRPASRLSRGGTRLQRDDRAGARAEFDAALTLSSRHKFDYLTMQMPRPAGCRRGQIRKPAADARREQRGPRRCGRPPLGEHDVVGHRHRDPGLHRTPARRAHRGRTPQRPSPGLRNGDLLAPRSGPPCMPSTAPPSLTSAPGCTGWPSCTRPARTPVITRPAPSSAPRWRCWSSGPPCTSGIRPRRAPSSAG